MPVANLQRQSPQSSAVDPFARGDVGIEGNPGAGFRTVLDLGVDERGTRARIGIETFQELGGEEGCLRVVEVRLFR